MANARRLDSGRFHLLSRHPLGQRISLCCNLMYGPTSVTINQSTTPTIFRLSLATPRTKKEDEPWLLPKVDVCAERFATNALVIHCLWVTVIAAIASVPVVEHITRP